MSWVALSFHICGCRQVVGWFTTHVWRALAPCKLVWLHWGRLAAVQSGIFGLRVTWHLRAVCKVLEVWNGVVWGGSTEKSG